MMRHFIRVDGFGQIVEHVMWGEGAPTPEHIEVSDVESKRAVSQDMDRIRWRDGIVSRKPVVEFVASKGRLLADGIDEVTIEVKGLDPESGPLRVLVNGVPGEIIAGEPITITTRSPGPIRIRGDSKTVFSMAKTVLAVVPT